MIDKSYELIYLKSRDQIIEGLKAEVKAVPAKIADELDFYPEELRSFMGLTLMGKPIKWRFRGNNADIFEISIELKIPGSTDPATIDDFILKDTWFDVLSTQHKLQMDAMKSGNVPGEWIPSEGDPEIEVRSEEEYEEENESDDIPEDDEFEEDALVYIKTAADMGISNADFRAGAFTGSEYYPESLRPHAGQVLHLEVAEYYTEVEHIMHKHNRLDIMVPILNSSITINIPCEEESDSETLLFDYKNWISLFVTVIETSGSHLSELIGTIDYLKSIGASEPIIRHAVVDEASPATTTCCRLAHTKIDNTPEIGTEFIGILAGHKELGISETEFYCKTFKGSDKYPNEIMHLAGTALPAFLIDKEYAIVSVGNTQYDVLSCFIKSIDDTVTVKATLKEAKEWHELGEFNINTVNDRLETKEAFIFITYPEVSSRIKSGLPNGTSVSFITMLKEFVHISRLTLALIDCGIASDFIIITDFLKNISAVKIPINLLDNLMFYQIESKMQVRAIDTDGAYNSNIVDISYLDDTPEDEYLKEFADDEFASDMNSGSGLKRTIINQYPSATFIELRRI